MARILFPQGEQSAWITNLLTSEKISLGELAKICGISNRSARDWKREKSTLPKDALLKLSNYFGINTPTNIKELPDYWYALKGSKKGAQRRMELYGPPGTPEGRIKGGINSQLRRRENPEKYRLLGCNIPKDFDLRRSHSVEFSEAIGIILGDGGITKDQLRVTVSSIVDKPYAEFVCKLFLKVFKEKPVWRERKNCKAIDLEISGTSLVEELEKHGLHRGNKVKNQVDFPSWIWTKLDYQIACVRGLMDTDGGCYFHTHTVTGLTYKNFGMCFTNQSQPIIRSFAKVLQSLGLKFTVVNNKIYIYSFKEVIKYFELIGSNNPKNVEKFQYYLSQKSHRIFKS